MKASLLWNRYKVLIIRCQIIYDESASSCEEQQIPFSRLAKSTGKTKSSLEKNAFLVQKEAKQNSKSPTRDKQKQTCSLLAI